MSDKIMNADELIQKCLTDLREQIVGPDKITLDDSYYFNYDFYNHENNDKIDIKVNLELSKIDYELKQPRYLYHKSIDFIDIVFYTDYKVVGANYYLDHLDIDFGSKESKDYNRFENNKQIILETQNKYNYKNLIMVMVIPEVLDVGLTLERIKLLKFDLDDGLQQKYESIVNNFKVPGKTFLVTSTILSSEYKEMFNHEDIEVIIVS